MAGIEFSWNTDVFPNPGIYLNIHKSSGAPNRMQAVVTHTMCVKIVIKRFFVLNLECWIVISRDMYSMLDLNIFYWACWLKCLK